MSLIRRTIFIFTKNRRFSQDLVSNEQLAHTKSRLLAVPSATRLLPSSPVPEAMLLCGGSNKQ